MSLACFKLIPNYICERNSVNVAIFQLLNVNITKRWTRVLNIGKKQHSTAITITIIIINIIVVTIKNNATVKTFTSLLCAK